MNKENFQTLISLTLVIIYISAQYFFSEKIYAISQYASYFIDLSFIIGVWFIFSKKNRVKNNIPISISNYFLFLLLFLVSGIIIHIGAIKLHFAIPFDLSSNQVILLLLIIGPVLEELVFRYSFWEVFSQIFSKKYVVLIITSIIFSLSHLYSYWFISQEFQSFVLYQALYTLLLGIACGFYRQKYSSVQISIIAHGAFNLGFYIVRFI